MPDVGNQIASWEHVAAELRDLKALEIKLRKQIIDDHFLTLKEGVNRLKDIVSGNENDIELVVTQPYDYKVDESLPDEFKNATVFRQKIELDKKEYNKLAKAQQKELQRWLTIKPGSPSLKVIHKSED